MGADELWPVDREYYQLAGTRVHDTIESISVQRARIQHLPGWLVTRPRLKTDNSIREKLTRKRARRPDYSATTLTDLVGVRAIVESTKAAKELAAFIRRNRLFDVREKDSEEFIEVPRADGYRGVHMVLDVKVASIKQVIVPVELQIRTILQHHWSELSHSEFYKTVRDIPAHLLVRMRALSEVLNCAEIESDHLRRERILDECQRAVLGTLRVDVLENLSDGGGGKAREVGLIALEFLEFDKQLRQALVSEGPVQEVSLEAMDALTKLGERRGDCAAPVLRRVSDRVRAFVRTIPVID